MSASGITAKLAALEEARAGLEADLSGDENWRALKQALRADGEGGGAWNEARRLRDRRLELALQGNPLYQAWKHVNEAIGALRAGAEASSREPRPHAAESAVAHMPDADSDASGDALPDDILRVIRGTGSAPTVAVAAAPDEEPVAEPDPARPAAADAPVVAALPAHVAAAQRMDKLEAELREITDEPPDEPHSEPEAPKPAARETEKPISEAGPAAPVEAPEPISAPERPTKLEPTPEADPDLAPETAPAYARATEEPVEAKVSFVKRKPRAPLLPAANMPADFGTGRKSELFERLRGLDEAGSAAATEEQFEAPGVPPEEAEVTIIKGDVEIKGGSETKAESLTVRRFLKALSGE